MRPLNDNTRIIQLNSLEEDARRDLKRTHSVYFQGENHNLPVFKVDISFPLFRMENGRTKRKQIEFKHNNPDRAHELDDYSSASAQEIQLAILQEMAAEADLLELLKQGQHEPLLLRHDGYVVNGNRRLAAMRLLHSDPQKHKSSVDFSYVDVARLPVLEEKEIRRIEQRLQMSQDGKADYNWVDELLTIRANIDDFGMTIQELAKDMNKKKATIENQERMLTLINLYLDRLGKPGQYFEVEGDEEAFRSLAKGYAKFSGDTKRQMQLIELSFPIIFKNEAGESKHNRIRKIIEHLPVVTAKTYAEKNVKGKEQDKPRVADIVASLPADNFGTIGTLDLSIDSSEIVHEAIRALDREQDIQNLANGPAEAVAQAATLLKNIRITSSMTKAKQFRGQLKAIRATCDDLLEQLDNSKLELD